MAAQATMMDLLMPAVEINTYLNIDEVQLRLVEISTETEPIGRSNKPFQLEREFDVLWLRSCYSRASWPLAAYQKAALSVLRGNGVSTVVVKFHFSRGMKILVVLMVTSSVLALTALPMLFRNSHQLSFTELASPIFPAAITFVLLFWLRVQRRRWIDTLHRVLDGDVVTKETSTPSPSHPDLTRHPPLPGSNTFGAP